MQHLQSKIFVMCEGSLDFIKYDGHKIGPVVLYLSRFIIKFITGWKRRSVWRSQSESQSPRATSDHSAPPPWQAAVFLSQIPHALRESGNSSKLVDELGIVYAIGLTNINDYAYTLSHSIGAVGVSQPTMTTWQDLSSKLYNIKEGLSMYVYPSYV